MNVRATGSLQSHSLGQECRAKVQRIIADHLPDIARTIRVEHIEGDGSFYIHASSQETLERLFDLLSFRKQNGELEHLGRPYAEVRQEACNPEPVLS